MPCSCPETASSHAGGAGYRPAADHVTQAHQGADLDFLIGSSGDEVGRESH
ncbi:hypothetical protein ABT294_41905 [Nonomuraea sp. NPDC000554]|uniref:hypothetical protein n=1 Tax=Nonomuraea sp. NPDC000554 TaxID=3154259 RepID=UPI0033319309